MTAEYISQIDFGEIDHLKNGFICKVYLATYNHVKEGKCCTERLTEMVLEAFVSRKESSVQPVQWTVTKEPHLESRIHHIHVEFSNNKRWKGEKRHLLGNYYISVAFMKSTLRKTLNYFAVLVTLTLI